LDAGTQPGRCCLALREIGVSWYITGNSSDADLTVEANQPMQAELRYRKPEIALAALYRRRQTVLALIRSVERYRRTRSPRIQKRSRRARQVAT
jgi:hypothetical protein